MQDVRVIGHAVYPITCVRHSSQHSILLHGRFDISHGFQFIPHPRGLQGGLVGDRVNP